MAVANPKAFAAMGALFSGYPLFPGDPVKTAVVKAAGLPLIALCINTTWMLSGSILRSLMSDPKISRIVNITFAAVADLLRRRDGPDLEPRPDRSDNADQIEARRQPFTPQVITQRHADLQSRECCRSGTPTA